jgi:hypothetical protein
MNRKLREDIKRASKVLILTSVGGQYLYVSITKKAAEEFLDTWEDRYDSPIPYEIRSGDGRIDPWLYID